MTNATEALLPRLGLESATPVELETTRARRLNHLQALEAESIYILREAAAEFARPVKAVTSKTPVAWKSRQAPVSGATPPYPTPSASFAGRAVDKSK